MADTGKQSRIKIDNIPAVRGRGSREVHRVPAIRDRSSCPNWQGNERGRNNGGSWYGFRIGGLLALPAPDDVFEPTFLMTN
ncbi:hypothetical protein WN51_08342 [Melipona quadrifasciata]|uniref:Uncharacterized protein n=1 Tax=Melipona quadrifasciata TaxID=166423 RepID=A0A0M9A9T8_9HYME|nr:hypothetical protein WN51_08342 [Melipona quadrifasciata]